MATKTLAPKAPAALADEGSKARSLSSRIDAPEPKATAHPPATDYEQVWVFHEGVALANNQVGYLWALKTDAATMYAAGDAVSAYTNPLPYITKKPAPPPVVTVAITAFSAANPTVATASAGDVAKLAAGDRLTLTQTAGTTLPPLSGTGTVAAPAGTSFSLTGIDLSAFAAVVAGVTATGTKQ